MPTIVVDLDDTVARFVEGVENALGPAQDAWSGSLERMFPGYRSREFDQNREFYAGLRPVPGAVQALNELAADGWTVCYVSARPKSYDNTSYVWLIENGFPDGLVLCCGSNKNKLIAAQSLRPDVAIDDRAYFLRDLHRLTGCYPILYATAWGLHELIARASKKGFEALTMTWRWEPVPIRLAGLIPNGH